MGCTSSKVDNEEGVARCRARKRHIKHAVSSRHAFASAHAHYVQALKASGAAFRQFAEGEQGEHRELAAPQTPVTPATPLTPLLKFKEALPPPPPPHLSAKPSSSPPGEVSHRSLSGRVPDLLLLGETARGPLPDQAVQRPESRSDITVVSQPNRDSSEDDWVRYNASRAPPPTQPSNPPPPPPVPRNSWQSLFFDPFRPVPEVEFNNPPSPPFHEVEQARIHQALEGTSEEKNSKEDDDMPPLEEDRIEEEDGGKEGHVQLVETPKPEVITESHQESAVVERIVETNLVERTPNNEFSVHTSPKGRDLLEVLRDVDDMFLKAAECGEVVSRMLETKKVHYHSSFSEVRGFAENSAKVFNSTFWTRSLSKNSSASNGLLKEFALDNANGDGKMGSHASTLDRLFAWEKKLYDEVKSAEVIRIDLEKNCTRLRNQDAKGDDPLAIDKTRALIKVLHTRFMVALQAVDTANSTVHTIRDDELYPQLLELSEGLANMWKEMNECHQAQQLIAQEMETLTNSAAEEATTSMHRQSTLELASCLVKLAQSFSSIMTTQKEYLNNLTGWLRLSLVQPDAELRDDQSKSASSATKVANTPIYSLCEDWHRAVEKLPDKVTLEAINGFVAVVNEWVRLQSEELKHKKKAESLERELIKKEQFLEMLERKYVDSTPVSDEKDEFVTDSPRRAALNENKSRVDQFRLKVELEKEEVEKSIQATRAMTLTSCQSGLPGLFSALNNFCSSAHQTYRDIHAHAVNINLARIAG